jgi:uncharacterized protein YdaU (DUF1376 family)
MHYYQHNIADYRKDAAHLSILEHGIYRQLLDQYYLNEEPIETQLVIRRLSIKTEEEHLALKSVLDDFFTVSECGVYYTQDRCDLEIAKYHAKADIARVNGSKGGRPNKPKITQLVNLANPEKSGSKANYKPLNNKPLTNKQTAPTAVFDFSKSLIEIGVNKDVVSDWLKVRAKKKAANTKTAFAGLEKQITASGLPANDAITLAVENSWAGFKSAWITEHQGNAKKKPLSDSELQAEFDTRGWNSIGLNRYQMIDKLEAAQ